MFSYFQEKVSQKKCQPREANELRKISYVLAFPRLAVGSGMSNDDNDNVAFSSVTSPSDHADSSNDCLSSISSSHLHRHRTHSQSDELYIHPSTSIQTSHSSNPPAPLREEVIDFESLFGDNLFEEDDLDTSQDYSQGHWEAITTYSKDLTQLEPILFHFFISPLRPFSVVPFLNGFFLPFLRIVCCLYYSFSSIY